MKFSGNFEASFFDPETRRKYILRHRLSENDRDPTSYYVNGMYGGNYVQFFTPEKMQLEFDKDYTVEKDLARKIWENLTLHGWIPAEDYFKLYK